jgi:hypothetical protein
MFRTIRISEAIWELMEKNGRFGESADAVLRRLLDLPPASKARSGSTHGMAHTRPGHATNRLERRVGDGVLELSFASGESKRWPLPSPEEKAAIREVLRSATNWAKEHDASLGQVNAIRKSLTDNGYHLTK